MLVCNEMMVLIISKQLLRFSTAAIIQLSSRAVSINASSIKAGENIGQNVKPWTEIPGPASMPIIGPLLNFLPKGSLYNIKGVKLSQVLHERYGPIVRLEGMFGKPPIIFIIDADASSQILRGENWLPHRPGFETLEYYRKVFKKNKQKTGLISDQGEDWKSFRSSVNQIMLQPKTIKLYEPVLEVVSKEMIQRIRSNRDKNNMMAENFDTEMNLWSLESIGVVALGGRLNCLDPNLPKDSPAYKLIQCVHDIFYLANELDFGISIWRYYPTKTFKRAMETYEEQERLSKIFIDRAIKEIISKRKDDEEKGILEKLLDIDESTALIMASDMLFAGVDTTSNTITSTLYLLAKYPEKQEKLRNALSSENGARYLTACLKESLRMMPVTGGNIRRLTKDYNNILGYNLPKGMTVTFAHQYLANMDSHFPKPNEYVPERWIVNKDDPLYHGNAHPFAYNPFGFGVRSCIGKRIAMLELEIFLKHLIQNFRVEWTGPPMKIKPVSLNYTEGPYYLKFIDL